MSARCSLDCAQTAAVWTARARTSASALRASRWTIQDAPVWVRGPPNTRTRLFQCDRYLYHATELLGQKGAATLFLILITNFFQICGVSSATWSGTRMSVASRCQGGTAWTCAAVQWVLPGVSTVRSVPDRPPRSTEPSVPEGPASPTEQRFWPAGRSTKVPRTYNPHSKGFVTYVSRTLCAKWRTSQKTQCL